MAIETLLTNLIKAIQDNTAAINGTQAAPAAGVPVAAVPAPAPAAVPVPAAPAAVPAAGMPEVPFAVPDAPPPPPAPPAPTAPFHDVTGLMNYVGMAYNKLGSSKGSMILDVLRSFGVDNISGLPVAKFGEFYEKIEALLK